MEPGHFQITQILCTTYIPNLPNPSLILKSKYIRITHMPWPLGHISFAFMPWIKALFAASRPTRCGQDAHGLGIFGYKTTHIVCMNATIRIHAASWQSTCPILHTIATIWIYFMVRNGIGIFIWKKYIMTIFNWLKKSIKKKNFFLTIMIMIVLLTSQE